MMHITFPIQSHRSLHIMHYIHIVVMLLSYTCKHKSVSFKWLTFCLSCSFATTSVSPNLALKWQRAHSPGRGNTNTASRGRSSPFTYSRVEVTVATCPCTRTSTATLFRGTGGGQFMSEKLIESLQRYALT